MINEELIKDLYKGYEEIDNIWLKTLFREVMKLVDNYVDLKERIDKTIDFIDNWEKYKKDKGSLEVSMIDLLYIKEILGEKENE